MNISVKICDFCDTCVYEGEYEIRNREVKCIMCIEEERIQTLNETVDRILQYKNVDMNNIVIELKDTDYKTHYDNVYDISDYNDLRPMVPHEVNDAYIDDLAARELVYSHNMRMWIPKDEKKR